MLANNFQHLTYKLINDLTVYIILTLILMSDCYRSFQLTVSEKEYSDNISQTCGQ
jgi:hypothetical protein